MKLNKREEKRTKRVLGFEGVLGHGVDQKSRRKLWEDAIKYEAIRVLDIWDIEYFI